jgi:prepilin-type N-terminal cleavage/methylation domain-containing protein
MTTAQQIKKGFTLIEVLVVIGILGILATVALVAINPAEAQKKARDVQRLKDMATLQSVMEQYLADNPGTAGIAAGWAGGVSSGANVYSGCGTSNWLTVNLCPYLSVLPKDPQNRSTKMATGTAPYTAATVNAYYYFKMTSGAYKFCTYLESAANATKLTADGGSITDMFEVFSDSTATCP